MIEEAYFYAELDCWPDKDAMAALLQSAGLRVTVTRRSLRLTDFSHFTFQDFGGDICEPSIDADSDNLEKLCQEAVAVSAALGKGGVRHRFEIYNETGELVRYFHHEWPAPPRAAKSSSQG